MKAHTSLVPLPLVAFCLLCAAYAQAGPKVDIATGPRPPKLVQLAADEMAGQLKALFDAEVAVAGTAPVSATNVILIGNPDTNPAIRAALGDRWPKLSEQGHIVKSVDAGGKKLLVVGGGRPVATLWAAYELGHRFGIRYLINGDVLPPIRPEFKLDGFDVLLEPVFSVRAWRTLGEESIGLASWGRVDQQKLIKQLAKLKFNRIEAKLSFEAPVFLPGRFPVDGDTPGRKAFRGAKEFVNPDFAKLVNPKDRNDVGFSLAVGISDAAQGLGMTCGIDPPVDGREQRSARPARPLVHLPLTHPALIAVPQIHAKRLHASLAELRSQQQAGFVATCEFTGELDPVVHYLARASFDAALTPEAAYDDLFTTMCGRGDVTGRLTLAFKLIEEANDKIESQPSTIGRALLNGTEMLNAPASQAVFLKEVSDLYIKSTNEMLRAHGNCHPETRRPLYYYTKRGELAMHYMACVTALDAAAEARRKGNKDAVTEQLEKAVESLYNALNAQGEVARDQCDRALIAVLTAQGYRPLVKELEKAGEE